MARNWLGDPKPRKGNTTRARPQRPQMTMGSVILAKGQGGVAGSLLTSIMGRLTALEARVAALEAEHRE